MVDSPSRAFALLVFVIATCLAQAAGAAAAPGWLASEARSLAGDLQVQSQSWNGGGGSLATNARGDAVVVWHRQAGFDAGTVQSAIHRAGAPPTTSPLLNVTPNDYNPNLGTGTRTGGSEAITLDDAGNAYVFYSVQGADGFRDLVYRRAPPRTSDWGPPTTLIDSTNAGNEASGIVATTNPSGQTILYALAGSTRTFFGSPDGTFTDAGGLGLTRGGERLAINDAGDVGLARFNLGGSPTFPTLVNTVFRPRGGPWQGGTLRDATADADAEGALDLGIGGDGTLITVWVEPGPVVGGVQWKKVWYVTRPPEGPVSSPTALSLDGINSTHPSIAMNESGEAVIVYQEGPGNILMRSRAPNGAVDSLGYLQDEMATSVTAPNVALNDAGEVVVIYNAVVGGSQVVRAVRRPAGDAAFGPPTTLSPANSSNGDVVVNRFGDSFAGFATTPTMGQPQIVVRSAGFDNSGPQIENVSFPSTAFNNVAFDYSVQAVDAWSPLGSVQWAFGDGTTAAGASGSKAYAANGAYTATVSATDARGHGPATGTANVTVSNAPPPGQAALAGLTVKPKAFFAARSGPSVARARPGTVVSYTDTQTATTRFTVHRRSRGYRKGGRCVRRKPRPGLNPKRCSLYRAVKGSFSHDDTPGPNSLRFTGRLGRKTLKPGPYRLKAVARNPFGKSTAVRTSFRVKKPRRRR